MGPFQWVPCTRKSQLNGILLVHPEVLHVKSLSQVNAKQE